MRGKENGLDEACVSIPILLASFRCAGVLTSALNIVLNSTALPLFPVGIFEVEKISCSTALTLWLTTSCCCRKLPWGF